MRKDSLLGAMMVTLVLLSGCAPKLKNPMASPQPGAAILSRGDNDSFGNTQKSTWSRFSDSVKRGTDKVKLSKDKLVSNSKPKVSSPPDPTNLATPTPAASPSMHVSMAKLMERSGKHVAAEDHYQKALAIDSGNLESLLCYARFLDRQGRLEQAARQYETACRANPQSAAAFNDLGLCYARSNSLEEAAEALDRAIELQPERKLYRNNIATVLTELGRYDDATSHFAAAHGPSVAHYNMGILLQQRGRFGEAADHFAQATSLDPGFEAARHWSQKLADQGHRSLSGGDGLARRFDVGSGLAPRDNGNSRPLPTVSFPTVTYP